MNNKTEGELRQEMKQNQEKNNRQAFLEAYEAAVTPVMEKYKLRLVPIINTTETGIFPMFAVQQFSPTPNEEAHQPETDERADSNDQTP